MNWSEVTARVVVEAVAAHPHDVVVQLGGADIVAALAGRVKRAIAVLPEAPRQGSAAYEVEVGDLRTWRLPPGVSVVVLHDQLRLLPKREQTALVQRLGREMAPRALLVIGDVMWSMPMDQVDEPEQYGAPLGDPPETRWIEDLSRTAGFLPDLHRFGVGRAVLIALRGER